MKLLAPAVAAGLLFSAGCVHIHTSPATPRTETRTIQRQGAETVDVEVSMAAGKLSFCPKSAIGDKHFSINELWVARSTTGLP
jgi:hypothetical protein